VAGLALVAAVAAGCSQASSAPTTTVPLKAGKYPSKVSKEVCVTEAPKDVGLALDEKAKVTTPTWVDHLYSCTFQYPNASMTLSVKELSSKAETTAYFDGLGQQLGVARPLQNLGQGAFQTTDGSVVVRKDYKVLLVDITHLPAHFGNPPTTSGDIAVTVADVVLGCWAGD
jgi:hypothetical protein